MPLITFNIYFFKLISITNSKFLNDKGYSFTIPINLAPIFNFTLLILASIFTTLNLLDLIPIPMFFNKPTKNKLIAQYTNRSKY